MKKNIIKNETITNNQTKNSETEGAVTIDNDNVSSSRINDDFVAIAVRHCLFCSSNFDCLEDAMSHMTQRHGFFVPCMFYIYVVL